MAAAIPARGFVCKRLQFFLDRALLADRIAPTEAGCGLL
jgi:hypothetical protein